MHEVQGHGFAVDFDYAGIVFSVGRDPSKDENMVLSGDGAMPQSGKLVGSDGVVKGPDNVYLLLHVIKMILQAISANLNDASRVLIYKMRLSRSRSIGSSPINSCLCLLPAVEAHFSFFQGLLHQRHA